MSKIESNWQFAEQYPQETEAITAARRAAMELGVEPVSSSVAAYLTSISVISNAQQICELGTGTGVSTLALLRHNHTAQITSIDVEPEHQKEAKKVIANANISSSRARLIEGDAHQVLPRLNHNAYDLLLIDANPDGLLEYVEHGLQVVRPGGSIIVPNAFWRGTVPAPAHRDTVTTAFRDLLQMVVDAPGIAASLSPVGDGVLTITKTA